MEPRPNSPLEKALDTAIKEHKETHPGPVSPMPDLRIGPQPTKTTTTGNGQENK